MWIKLILGLGRTKTILLVLVFSFCLLSVGTCSAAYLVTPGELQELQDNLTALASLNQQQLNSLTQSGVDLSSLKLQLTQSQDQLQTLKTQLTALQQETATAKSELQIAQAGLKDANKLLVAYGKEVKSEHSKLIIERDLLLVAVGYLLFHKQA